MCRLCSKEKQRPIYHNYCENIKKRGLEKESILATGLIGPSATRLQHDQMDKAAIAAWKKPRGSHPCRLSGCPHHSYTTYHHANSHMTEKHQPELNSNTIQLYEKEQKQRNKKVRKRRNKDQHAEKTRYNDR